MTNDKNIFEYFCVILSFFFLPVMMVNMCCSFVEVVYWPLDDKVLHLPLFQLRRFPYMEIFQCDCTCPDFKWLPVIGGLRVR